MVQTRTELAIIYDEPSDVPPRRDGTDSRFEMMSMTSVQSIEKAIEEIGWAQPIQMSSLELFRHISKDERLQIHLAVNLSSGLVDRWRYAQAPMALDMLDIAYTGSSLFSILICRDKQRAKMLCRKVVTSAEGVVVRSSSIQSIRQLKPTLFPVILKPNAEGGSTGVELDTAIAETVDEAESRASELLKSFPEGVLVERFVAGAEATVVVLGNGPERTIVPLVLAQSDGGALDPNLVRTQSEKSDAFLTGDRLWFPASQTHGKRLAKELVEATQRVADTLGLLDIARLDFRISTSGKVVFVEANAQPTFVPGNTALARCNEIHFRDPLGVEKAFLNAAWARTNTDLNPTKR